MHRVCMMPALWNCENRRTCSLYFNQRTLSAIQWLPRQVM